MDIHLDGYLFIWWRGRDPSNRVEERLDMAMASHSWLNLFPNVKLSNLVAPVSDHSPVLLNCETLVTIVPKKVFRLENAWLAESELDIVMRDIRALTIDEDLV